MFDLLINNIVLLYLYVVINEIYYRIKKVTCNTKKTLKSNNVFTNHSKFPSEYPDGLKYS